MCRSSQGFVLSLDMTHEPKNLFLGVWQHKVWLTVLGKVSFNEVERVFLEKSFSVDKISIL